MSDQYDYENWPSRRGEGWGDAVQGDSPWDNLDFHVDLGCGTVKKGRIGVDRYAAPGVDVVCDLENAELPFGDGQIKSVITHHCLEHIGEGFLPLMQEVHRVLEPGGVLRIIVPLYPSTSAVADPDHCRYFMEQSFASFYVNDSGGSWLESFSVPYIGTAKFMELETIGTPPTPIEDQWTAKDAREMRVAMRKWGL